MPTTPPTELPFAVEYYYKTRWGFADEFARLFRKNHFPVLKAQVESGRMLEVRVKDRAITLPALHRPTAAAASPSSKPTKSKPMAAASPMSPLALSSAQAQAS